MSYRHVRTLWYLLMLGPAFGLYVSLDAVYTHAWPREMAPLTTVFLLLVGWMLWIDRGRGPRRLSEDQEGPEHR